MDNMKSMLIPEHERISNIHINTSETLPFGSGDWITLPERCRQEYILCNSVIIGFVFYVDTFTRIYVYGKTGFYEEHSGEIQIIFPSGGTQGFKIGKVVDISRRAKKQIAGIELREYP